MPTPRLKTPRKMGPTEAARRLRLSVKALKTYERFGILRPQRTRTGWRYYSAEDLDRASRALAFKAMGFRLAQIAVLLDAPADEISAALAAQEQFVRQRCADLEEALSAIRRAMNSARPPLRLVA